MTGLDKSVYDSKKYILTSNSVNTKKISKRHILVTATTIIVHPVSVYKHDFVKKALSDCDIT